MPIRSEFQHFYRGPAWRATRARILKRAKNRCEQCLVPNRELVERGPYGVWRPITAPTGTPWRNHKGNHTTFEPIPSSRRRVRIVLTIAHLNQIPGDDRDENLAALCQYCHLHHDRERHASQARTTRQNRKDVARPLLRDEVTHDRRA